jgi:putative pyruvate formate lyase activating enzyme
VSEPSYIRLYRNGTLKERVDALLGRLESCRLCPRECGVNRLKGETGVCRTGRRARIASYNAHFGEEAPLVGRYGSGTLFLSSCNLLCSFCQNDDISHHNEGVEVEPAQLAQMMIELAKRGCHNINFVTPTHVVPQLVEALIPAIEQGLNVPLVYNSGGYERTETLERLDGIFDIYMPDFKFWESRWSEEYCSASDYREKAVAAIKEMHRQVGDLRLDDAGIAVRGLLVRHLVMPNNVSGTDKVLRFIAQEISKNTYMNVMDQYRPCGTAHEDGVINRRLTRDEFKRALGWAEAAGLTRLDNRERPRIMFGF